MYRVRFRSHSVQTNLKVTSSISPCILGKVTHSITPCTMGLIIQKHKRRQSFFVHSSYCYAQSAPVVQYREPPMGGTSVLHTNYNCPAIHGTCDEQPPFSTTHKLHLSYNTVNLSWACPPSTASKLHLSYNIGTGWPRLRQNGIWIFRGNARNVPKICFYAGNLLQH